MFDWCSTLVPGSALGEAADIVIAGNGNNWGTMNPAAEANSKVLVGGEASVRRNGITGSHDHISRLLISLP